MNPGINKRIKTKRIEDLRKQAINNVKKSMSIIEAESKLRSYGHRSASFRTTDILPGMQTPGTAVEPPKSIAVQKSD